MEWHILPEDDIAHPRPANTTGSPQHALPYTRTWPQGFLCYRYHRHSSCCGGFLRLWPGSICTGTASSPGLVPRDRPLPTDMCYGACSTSISHHHPDRQVIGLRILSGTREPDRQHWCRRPQSQLYVERFQTTLTDQQSFLRLDSSPSCEWFANIVTSRY